MSKNKRKFQMPSAMILLFIVLILVSILTWFIPTSVVTTSETGERIIHYNAAFDADGNVVENAGTIRNEALPAKVGFWQKFKAFWLQDIDWNKEIRVELTPGQQKVEDEINEFLHQEITWGKVHDFLFQEVSFGK